MYTLSQQKKLSMTAQIFTDYQGKKGPFLQVF